MHLKTLFWAEVHGPHQTIGKGSIEKKNMRDSALEGEKKGKEGRNLTTMDEERINVRLCFELTKGKKHLRMKATDSTSLPALFLRSMFLKL